MIDDKEGAVVPASQISLEGIQPADYEKLDRYTQILLKEATSALSKYLPEALPQEPTEVLIGVVPNYLGRLQGKHYIGFERDPDLDPVANGMKALMQNMEWAQETFKLFGELEIERFKSIDAKAETGDYDFTEIDQQMAHNRELVKQRPRPEVKPEPKDWHNPEKLLEGSGQFSELSWRGVYSLVHELIHQKQAELNPAAFPDLATPELEDKDPDTIPHRELYDLLVESHRENSRSQITDSLFYPVVEGMAVIGSLYVMGKLADELTASNEEDAANRIRVLRRSSLHTEAVISSRKEKEGNGSYEANYAEGIRLMRKLSENLGFENLPNFLVNVDLAACRQMTKGSPEYQQIVNNPSLLPKLPQVA